MNVILKDNNVVKISILPSTIISVLNKVLSTVVVTLPLISFVPIIIVVNALLAEDGTFLLCEDGTYLLFD